ncbi:MAG TPA: molybdopterin-dependent oxidoreductase, partial [Actinomycetota bacterium]|nr:molybdopterin-dependent oxidoreductase [Actinomycetota bacterium]
RSVENDDDRAAFGDVWGIDPPSKRGLDARAILQNASGLGVLFLAGVDPASDFEDRELAARALDDAPFVVVLDLFFTESSRRADVVLPAAAVYERDGTITNWEGRAQPVRAAVPPAGLAQSDFEILAHIAAEAGVQFPSTLEALSKEMNAVRAQPGAARAVTAGATTPPQSGGLVLATHRPLIDDGTMMLHADALAQTASSAVVEVNPEDARGLSNGDPVVVRTAAGEARASVLVTDAVARGVVFVPAHAGFAGRAGEPVTLERAGG